MNPLVSIEQKTDYFSQAPRVVKYCIEILNFRVFAVLHNTITYTALIEVLKLY